MCVCAGCGGRWRGRGRRFHIFSSCHAHLLHFAGPPLSELTRSSVCGGSYFLAVTFGSTTLPLEKRRIGGSRVVQPRRQAYQSIINH